MSRNGRADNLAHLFSELERIDRLIACAVARLRATEVDTPDGLRGLYVSDGEVDAILGHRQPVAPGCRAAAQAPQRVPRESDVSIQVSHAHAAERTVQQLGVDLRLPLLAAQLGLTPFQLDIVLICLAPELDLSYERLYAYLQDDVTRKRPSVDLALNLLCSSREEKVRARREFSADAPLVKHQILHLIGDQSQPHAPLLAQYLKLDDRIVDYVLGSDEPDTRLLGLARCILPSGVLDELLLPHSVEARLRQLAEHYVRGGHGLVLYLHGPYGTGKRSAAEALAGELGLPLLVVDGQRLISEETIGFQTAACLAAREALLSGAAMYWSGFDVLLADQRRFERDELLRLLDTRHGLTILSADRAWEPTDAMLSLPYVRIELGMPGSAERLQLWSVALQVDRRSADALDLPALASRFRFSGGQIRDAVRTARNLARARDPLHARVSTTDLYTASRLHSNSALASLARKIIPQYTWSDIVLPPDRIKQLRELCNYVRFRSVVYEEWGFDRKLALGKGLNALFAGPSGTGKTMAAEILAADLGLELYKIDLSAIVSKYVGETEKQLERIFAAAETSNAILFFDEADALFGKRTEVRDAHDRYANIETSYLLQKMEAYDGVAILTTNVRKNIDSAFVRRMHFVIEFPFPTELERVRIWSQIWPDDTPRSADLDLRFLADRLELAGGNIRNIALAAAFLAATDGGRVTMAHVVRSARREYQKLGKVIAEDEFGCYSGLVRTHDLDAQ